MMSFLFGFFIISGLLFYMTKIKINPKVTVNSYSTKYGLIKLLAQKKISHIL